MPVPGDVHDPLSCTVPPLAPNLVGAAPAEQPAGGGGRVMEYGTCMFAVKDCASVTVTAALPEPAAVGTPEMVPVVGLIFNPGGSVLLLYVLEERPRTPLSCSREEWGCRRSH